jgi:hypothetical protein
LGWVKVNGKYLMENGSIRQAEYKNGKWLREIGI